MANSTNSSRDDYHLSNTKAYVVVIDIIAAVGVIGNILIFILMCNKTLRQFSYSILLRYLAVFDTVVLVFTVTEDTIEKTYSHERLVDELFNSGTVKCYLWAGTLALSRFISPWLLVGLSVDRVITVAFPAKRNYVCSKRNVHLFSIAVFNVSIFLNFAGIICAACKTECSLCRSFKRNGIVFGVFNATLNTHLPVLLIFCINLYTIMKLKYLNSLNRQGRKYSKATVAIVIVTCVSFLSLFPKSVIELVEIIYKHCCTERLKGESGEVLYVSWHVTNAIMLLNFAQNFYVLLLASHLYREIWKHTFPFAHCWAQRKLDTNSEALPLTQIEEDDLL